MTPKEQSLSEERKLRKPVYRQIKVVEPFCPMCAERLIGNNSLAHPWRCSCGEWESDWLSGSLGLYKIKVAGKGKR